MQNPNEFDPYQPPVSTDPAQAGVPKSESEGYLKDPGFRGKVALIAISIQVLLKFILAFTMPQSEWVVVLTIAHVVAYLASMTFFLIWLYRVASNVQRITRHTDVTPGWAVGFYFIPIVNWVAPAATMRSIIRATFVNQAPGALPTIAVVWWLSFIVSNIIQRFSYEPAMFGLWALAIGVSWGCVVVLVTRISRCQARFRRPDEPPRFRMTPLSRPQGSRLQPLQFRKIEQKTTETTERPDIESGWGGG